MITHKQSSKKDAMKNKKNDVHYNNFFTRITTQYFIKTLNMSNFFFKQKRNACTMAN